jgi:hypothetical protein
MGDKPVDPNQNPAPDPVFVRIDQLLAQMQRSLDEIRTALFVMAQIPSETMEANEARAKRSSLISQVMTGVMSGRIGGYMAGRWHRRDGDVYGNVRQPGVPREDQPDANNPPGDIRPTDKR